MAILLPPAWLLWSIPVLLAALGWQIRDVVATDVGGQDDQRVVQGFYRREQGLTDTLQPYTYRWSEPEASLLLPARTLPGIVELRGSVPPDGTVVRLRLGTRVQVSLPPSSGVEAVRRYQFLWPDDTDAWGWVRVGISTIRPDQRVERRSLGMLIAGVTLASVEPVAFRLPPLPLVLALASLAPLLALCLRLGGLSARVSTALGLALGCGWVAMWGWQPWWIQPFVLHCLAALLALAGVLGWLRQVAPGLTLMAPNNGSGPHRRRMHSASKPQNTLNRIADAPPPSDAGAGLQPAPPHHTSGQYFHPFQADFLLVLVVFSGLVPLYLLLKYGLAPGLSLEEALVLWLHPVNLPVVAMLAGLALPWSTGRWRRGLLGVVAGSVLVYGVERYVGAIGKDYATDFTAMFRGVRSFVQGGALYNLDNIYANHLGDTYKYPPFFVFLMAPLAGLRYEWAILAWHLANFALLLLAAGLLWRWSGQPLRSWSTLGLLYLLLTFKPIVDTLGNGQTDIIILVCLAAALLALKHEQWGGWGALLALPAAIKLYPAYLLVHGVVLRRWHSLVGFGAMFGLFYGLAVGVLGWEVHATFLYEVMPAIGGGTAWVENQTINGFLNRLTARQIALLPDEPGLIRWLTYAGAALLTGWTLLRVRQMTPESGFGLWIVTLLIIVPIAWMHYQTVLLIPLYQLLVRLERSCDESLGYGWTPGYGRTLLLYALAWLLLCYGNQWTFFDRTMHGPVWALLLSYKLYGLGLLWVAVAYDPTAALGVRD